MLKTVLTAVLAAIAAVLATRQYDKRKLEYVTSIHLDEIRTQSQLSYNHGFGEGHALGVENERRAHFSHMTPR